MKNKDTSKLIPTRAYHAQTRLTHAFKNELKRKVIRLYLNKEFTSFIIATISKLPARDKIAAFHFFRKLAVQVLRQPDPEHYSAFKDEYEEELSEIAEEQKHFEPVRFIEAEILYLTNTAEKLTSEDVNQRLDIMQEAKQRLSKQMLSKDEVMQLLGISKSTLSRRMSDGLKFYKKGKLIYFDLEEINQWMKNEAA